MRRALKSYFQKNDGSSSIEFVVLFFVIVATVFFVVEVTLYLFFSASLQKAAQAGVRAAVVSTPVAPGVPVINERSDGGLFGAPCPDNCVDPGTFPCTGGGDCVAGEFDRIFAHMNGFAGQLEPGHVAVSYDYDGLGYAGGPFIPVVNVTISNVPYRTGIVGLLLTNAGVLASLPTHSASMTGEDLNRGGAP